MDAEKPRLYEQCRKSHQPFHWLAEFYDIMASGGFDVIIGNPPYVEYSKVRQQYQINGMATLSCGNVYAVCTERSQNLLCSSGRFGFIVQAPLISTQRMNAARRMLRDSSDFLSYATFDDRPAKLCDGMHHCRLVIVLSRKRSTGVLESIVTTRYHKWYDVQRPFLFSTLQYLLLTKPALFENGVVPKFRSAVELSLYKKLVSMRHRLGELFTAGSSSHRLYYKTAGVGHWFTFTTRAPKFWRGGVEGSSTCEQSVGFKTAAIRDTAFCCLWSTLHYWLYQARTNCRDFNPSDLEWLPIPDSFLNGIADFGKLAKQIMKGLEESSSVAGGNYAVGGSVTYERFQPRMVNSLFDEVDTVLAKNYGFTDEELDFIVNYDIKYRMGQEGGEEGAVE